MYGRGGRKLEINIPLQQIYANSKGGLIIKGGILLSEYGTLMIIIVFIIHNSVNIIFYLPLRYYGAQVSPPSLCRKYAFSVQQVQ